MFALNQAFPVRIFRPAIVHPRFGGRPLRRSRSGHPVAVVLVLVGAIAATAAALPLAGNSAQAGAFARQPQAAAPRPAEVRTTRKADRLVAPPSFGDTCDGAWVDEPLECLLQTA